MIVKVLDGRRCSFCSTPLRPFLVEDSDDAVVEAYTNPSTRQAALSHPPTNLIHSRHLRSRRHGAGVE